MTTKEALLLKIIEECNELSQRCSKAIRFTLEEKEPGQDLTNSERLVSEYKDLEAAMFMLRSYDYIPNFFSNVSDVENRRIRIEKYLVYSRELGTVKD